MSQSARRLAPATTVRYDEPVATVEHPLETEPSPSSRSTPLAAAKVKQLMAEEPDADTLVLRLAIQGGGCSGFQYGLGFDRGSAEGDIELELEGVRVVVDPFSAPYLRGADRRLPQLDPGVGLQDRQPERRPRPAAAATPSRWTRTRDPTPTPAGLRLRLLRLTFSGASLDLADGGGSRSRRCRRIRAGRLLRCGPPPRCRAVRSRWT